MSVKIMVAKYMPDSRRGEPRNVGVLIAGPGTSAMRFYGQRPDGSVDGRRTPGMIRDLEAYKLWVEYWAEALSVGDSDRLLGLKTDSYYVEETGEVLRDPQIDQLDALADRYFEELVTERPPEESTASQDLVAAVDRLIESPAIAERVSVRREYTVPIQVKGHPVELRFPYAFENGRVTVGQRVLLGDESRAYGVLGRAQSLPSDYPPSIAFVLADELNTLDESGIYWLLEDECTIVQADLGTAEEDLAAAIGL